MLYSNNSPTCNSKSIAEKQQENMPCVQAKLLIVEGNIAAGKSIFSQRLGKQFGFLVHDEPAPKNPYLAKFYKEPKKYALKLQLWLFQQRFLMYVQSLKHIMKTGQGVILDRSVYSDLVFTNVVYNDGNISEDGYQYYLTVRERAMKYLQPPSAAIYLHTPPSICFKRLAKRGREYEQQIPLSYLAELEREHENVFNSLGKSGICPVLTYDWSNFGRNSSCEEITDDTNKEMQFYASGFNEIVSDIKNIKTSWMLTISDEFLQNCDSDSDILEKVFSIEGYEQVLREIPD